MWGVFFCYLILLFSYLVCGEFSFSSQVLILEMKRIVKSCTQKCSRDLTADSVACGHGFNCYQCELLWGSEAEDFYCKDVWFFFVFSSANLFYKCALLGLTMQFIPRNYFCLKTVSHFNSDCELLWKYFVNGCFFAMVRWANLGFCHVLTSTWLVSGHSQNGHIILHDI